LEYTHIPLDRQLATQGIRQFELDVFTDPAGGLYSDPAGPRVVAQAGLPPDLPPNDPTGILRRPGLKVLHVQDIDFRSTCLKLVICLRTIKRWSDDNPRHLPLMILIELKDDPIPDPGLGFVIPRQFGPSDVDAVDREIRSVFSERELLTPDDVRGRHATLEEGVLTRGWPRLADARGKVLFALDNEGQEKDLYLAGHPSLRGRVLFTSSRPGAPEAAFVKLNDPLTDGALIRDLVARGYIIRTRADADTVQARTGDTTQRDAALASGAQFVSTDYPVPNPAFGTGYFVALPGGGTARCNPVNAPRHCKAKKLERLHR
jgi:calcium-dependent phosphoinositide phospholipase C